MLRFSNIKLSIDEKTEAVQEVIRKLIGNREWKSFRLVKKALDARNRNQAYFIYTVDIELPEEEKILPQIEWNSVELISPEPELNIKFHGAPKNRPLIIGSGPAGMFAGLALAEAGCKPLIIERGEDVKKRTSSVQKFWNKGLLNPQSNVQFGEGGAGTFSDGKLMSGIKKDSYTSKVFAELVEAGAPEEILYLAKPHLGTDKLAQIVANIRKKIESLGGEYRFNQKLEDLVIKDGKIVAVKVLSAEGEYEIPAESVILAIGHSARDTFEMLHKRGVEMQSKPFSVGVRIEHPQELINKALYHNFFKHPAIGAADYKLSVHLPSGRSAYTFCMCPGGVVVAAASEPERVVTNGMSYYARDKENANSALLVGVNPTDFGSNHPLSGMYFQQEIEHKAYLAGGSNYSAPAQLCKDFLQKKTSFKEGNVKPSYTNGVKWGNLDELFPFYISNTLREAIIEMDKKLHGFNYPDAILTGAETRSSSPVRFTRGEDNQSPLKGLYPCGEGAGYAGGIVSAATDGLKTALKILDSNHL